MSDHLREIRKKVGHDLLVLPSAAVALFDSQGRMLLGKHSDRAMWVLPGGLVEPGEHPADCAVREVFEETGLRVELTGILGVFGGPDLVIHYSNGDVASYIATVFRGKIIGGEHQADGKEILELRYFFRDDLRSVPHSPWMDGALDALFAPDGAGHFKPPTWQP